MFLDYCLYNVQFLGKNEHIWKDQSLFFLYGSHTYCVIIQIYYTQHFVVLTEI
jgi:hypothetical protein